MLLTIIQAITAVLIPIITLLLSCLTVYLAKRDHGDLPNEDQVCRRCGGFQAGAFGKFTYTESIGSPRKRVAKSEPIFPETKILGSERHLICDQCAHHHLRLQILQYILMVIPYPVYLFVILLLIVPNGLFANFLIEALLVVLSFTGAASSWDLYRAVKTGESPLAEARDHITIRLRRNILGKDFSYYTRNGLRHLKK